MGVAVYRHRVCDLRQRRAKHGKIGIGRAANEDFVDPAPRDVEENPIRPGIRIRIEDRLAQRSRPTVVRVDNGEISSPRRGDDKQEQSCNGYGRSNHFGFSGGKGKMTYLRLSRERISDIHASSPSD